MDRAVQKRPAKGEGAYWRGRRERLVGQMEKDEAKLNAKLAKRYASEIRKLDREIAAYYAKYGEGNVIEYRKLLSALSDADRQMLLERMDEFGKRYPQWAHLLPVRESIYKLNELEGIKTSMLMQQLEIGALEVDEVQAHLEKQALRSANLAAEQMGFGSSFYTVDASVVKSTVGAAWASEKSFSESIWGNRQKLAAYLNDDFAKMVARGVPYEKCAEELSKRFENVSKRDIGRLVFTEGTFVLNEARAQTFEQQFERYTVSTCRDGRVCDHCRGIQDKSEKEPMLFSDRRPGENFPPFHPWCRCDHEIYVADWDAWIDDYVAKRGGDSLQKRLSSHSPEPGQSVRETKSSFAKAENMGELKAMMDGKYDVVMHGLDDLDFESVRSICCGIDDVLSAFPKAKSFTLMNSAKLGKGTIAQTGFSGTISLNRAFFEKLYSGALSAGRHEAAHLLEVAASKDAAEYAEAKWAQRILRRALKRMNADRGTSIKLDKAIDGISLYPSKEAFARNDARVKYSEGLAKAVELHYNGNSGNSPFIRYIIEEIEKEMS